MKTGKYALCVLVDACFDVNARLFVLLSLVAVLSMAAAVVEQPGLMWVAIAVGIVCGACRLSPSVCLVMSAVPVLSYGYVSWRLAVWQQADIANLCDLKRVTFLGRVLKADAREQAVDAEVAVLKVLSPVDSRCQGVVLVRFKSADELHCGDLLTVRTHLVKPKPPAQKWEFDYAAYLRRRSILCLTRGRTTVRRLRADEHPQDWSTQLMDGLYLWGTEVDRQRDRIIECHRLAVGRTLGDLLSSMVIGNRAVKLSGDLVDSFRDVGLSHLLAASGFNLTIASGAVFFAGSKLCNIDALVNMMVMFAIIVFVFLAGASPSVSRAAMMCSLTLLLRACYRAPHTMAVITAALLVTVALDPLSVTDIGLQLSYTAAAGIVLLSSNLARWWHCMRLPQWLCDTLSVIVAAQVSVLPILLYHFWQVGAFFVLANLLVAPVVAPITVIGFLSSVSACMQPVHSWFLFVAGALDWVVQWPLRFLVLVADQLASHKAARLVIGPPACLVVVIYYLSLSLTALCLQVKRWRSLSALMFMLSALALFWRPPLPAVTVQRIRNSTVTLTSDRKAIVEGRLTPAVWRYLTYYGVNTDTDLQVVEGQPATPSPLESRN